MEARKVKSKKPRIVAETNVEISLTGRLTFGTILRYSQLQYFIENW